MIRYIKRPTVNKTANYTVSPAKGDFSGTIFTTRGAGAPVTFTLPPPTPGLDETNYEFVAMADQNLIVDAGVGKAVVFNSLASRSLAASTAGQKIGARILALCDGVSWVLTGVGTGFTYTVA